MVRESQGALYCLQLDVFVMLLLIFDPNFINLKMYKYSKTIINLFLIIYFL